MEEEPYYVNILNTKHIQCHYLLLERTGFGASFEISTIPPSKSPWAQIVRVPD